MPNAEEQQRIEAKAKDEIVMADSPFARIRNAVIALAGAQTKQEKFARLKAVSAMLGLFEQTLYHTANRLAAVQSLLLQVTGGAIAQVDFKGPLADMVDDDIDPKTAMSMEDANGVPIPLFDPANSTVLVLPSHVPPFTIIYTLPDGEVLRVTPDEQPVADDYIGVEVVEERSTEALCPQCGNEREQPGPDAGWFCFNGDCPSAEARADV